MRPAEQLLDLIKEGLFAAASRVHIGRPYRELYNEFAPVELFDESLRRASTPLEADRIFNCRQAPLLSPKVGPGPTYSEQEALVHIKSRYERCTKCIKFTVPALMADSGRRAFLCDWRKEGLRDWEILSIVANAAVNIRRPLPDTGDLSLEHVASLRGAFDVLEQVDSALQANLFTDDLLRLNRQAFQIAFLRSWRLDVPSAASDEEAVEAFLIARYGLRSDDVEHADVFIWPEGNA
jgi:hypothetical protein